MALIGNKELIEGNFWFQSLIFMYIILGCHNLMSFRVSPNVYFCSDCGLISKYLSPFDNQDTY